MFATVVKISWSDASPASRCHEGLNVSSSHRRISQPICFVQEVCENKRPGYILFIKV